MRPFVGFVDYMECLSVHYSFREKENPFGLWRVHPPRSRFDYISYVFLDVVSDIPVFAYLSVDKRYFNSFTDFGLVLSIGNVDYDNSTEYFLSNTISRDTLVELFGGICNCTTLTELQEFCVNFFDTHPDVLDESF